MFNLTYFLGVNAPTWRCPTPLPHSNLSSVFKSWSNLRFWQSVLSFILKMHLVLTCRALSDGYLFFGGNLIHEKMLFIGFTGFERGRPKASKTNSIKAWNRNTSLRRGHKVQENKSSISGIKLKLYSTLLYKCWLISGPDLDLYHNSFLPSLPTFLPWE